MKGHVVIAGGTGLVGRSLTAALLTAGYEIVVLTRAPAPQKGAVVFAGWDGKTLGDWARFVDGAAAVVNLTGRSINCRHTSKNRRDILESRVNSVRVLGQAIAESAIPPGAYVQAAAVGIYGDAGARWCDESAPYGDDFVARVCDRWESAFADVTAPHTRKVLLRLGVVLDSEGGLLKVLSRLTRFFLGGQMGDGKQYISWIHISDLTHMFRLGIEMPEISGVYNASSPNPVANAEFMRQLRQTVHRPWSPPVPIFAARAGAWLMGTEASLALVSQRIVPRHFLKQDFPFEFPDLATALVDLVPAR